MTRPERLVRPFRNGRIQALRIPANLNRKEVKVPTAVKKFWLTGCPPCLHGRSDCPYDHNFKYGFEE